MIITWDINLDWFWQTCNIYFGTSFGSTDEIIDFVCFMKILK